MEDKRQFRRVPFKEPVQFRTKAQVESAGCVGCDLSEGGIRINSYDFIPLKEELTLTLPMDFGIQIEVPGRVVWVQRVPHSEYYQVGLAFTPQSDDNQVLQELHEYVESH